MRSIEKTALLLFLSNQSLSSVGADNNADEIISRLDSIKNALSGSYLDEVKPKALEPLPEPDSSLNLNTHFEDEDVQVPEPEPKLMLNETKDNDDYDSGYDSILKIRDAIEKIPDIVVRESVQNHFNLAQTEMHEYLERYIPEAKSEEKDQPKANKEKILRYFDEGFEKMVIKSEHGYAPENKHRDIFDNEMIDTIPDKNYDHVDLEATNGRESKRYDLTKQEIEERLDSIIRDQQMIKDVLKKIGDKNK